MTFLPVINVHVGRETRVVGGKRGVLVGPTENKPRKHALEGAYGAYRHKPHL
jgi:hypothetical protein